MESRVLRTAAGRQAKGVTLRQARRRWKAAIRKWQDRLLLNGYSLVLDYVDEAPEGVSVLPSGSWAWVAKAEVKPMYLQGRIIVSKSFIKGATDAEIEEKAAHELMHILMGRVMNFFDEVLAELPKAKANGYIAWWHEVNEFTTTHLTRMAGARSE